MINVVDELKFALKSVIRNPGYTVLATMILATGLGLTMFMFSAINAYILRPLPFPDANELSHLAIVQEDGGIGDVPVHDFLDWRDRQTSFESVTQRLAVLPEVEAATAASSLPGTFAWWVRYSLEGKGDEQPSPLGHYAVVAPNYFDFFGIPLLAGRTFDGRDREGIQRVAVVSDRFASVLGGPSAAIGQRFRVPGLERADEPITIVGVVPSVVQVSVSDDALPNIYVPIAQNDVRFLSVALRTNGAPEQHAALLRSTVSELDPDLPVYWLQSLDDWVDQARFLPRFITAMFVLFAAAGLLLAAVGLYGVLAHTVAVRTQEFGVRRALGASGREIVAMLARQGGAQIALGLGLGILAALGFARLLADILFGVSVIDPFTFGLVAAVLAVTSACASLLPARRAISVDPAVSLRAD